jgi:hypothetical protein
MPAPSVTLAVAVDANTVLPSFHTNEAGTLALPVSATLAVPSKLAVTA